MNKTSMAERIAELAGAVQYHSDLYYNKAKPEVTDAEYDAMVDELKSIVSDLEKTDASAPEIAQAKEVLNNVGATPSYGRKVTHSQMMGSLNKETTKSGVMAWWTKSVRVTDPNVKIAVTPKVDGCFRHDAMVMMANGEERPISEIKAGMSVLTINEATGKTEPKKVLSVLVRKDDHREAKRTGWMLLTFSGGRDVVCTEDHPFLTSNRGWIEAKNLTEGDMFVEPDFSC